jgi:23S rRNA pseudouridine1911/1915/1917 synthase
MGTSGLLILAKDKPTQRHINQQLMAGEVQKFYRALVHGKALPIGEWVHYMEPSPRAPKSVSLEPHEGWAPCRLVILSQVEVHPEFSEVIIELITGRTHQIRAQLSFAGFPIVGDEAYGSGLSLADYEKICLQAFELKFSLSNHEKKSLRLPQSPWIDLDFLEPIES